jgi:DNA-binding NarL/FixJ family response regulator
MPITLLLADDHQLVRQSLISLLEHEGFEVLGEA